MCVCVCVCVFELLDETMLSSKLQDVAALGIAATLPSNTGVVVFPSCMVHVLMHTVT